MKPAMSLKSIACFVLSANAISAPMTEPDGATSMILMFFNGDNSRFSPDLPREMHSSAMVTVALPFHESDAEAHALSRTRDYRDLLRLHEHVLLRTFPSSLRDVNRCSFPPATS
jgi:hypothetical protein